MRTGAFVQGITVTLTIAAFALVLSTCGGSRKHAVVQDLHPGSSQEIEASHEGLDNRESISLTDTLAELNDMETPDGVDAALFEELKDALTKALKERDGGKLAAAPPAEEINRIEDLEFMDNGDGTYTFTWSYKNSGDYNQNGDVDIHDITPLAQHYGEEAGDGNEWIDGDCSGVIDIGDIVPIARYYDRFLTGYGIYGGTSAVGEWQRLCPMWILLSENTSGAAGRLTLSWTLDAPLYYYYKVTAIYNNAIFLGLDSSVLDTGQAVRWVRDWAALDLYPFFYKIAVDAYGMVYVAVRVVPPQASESSEQVAVVKFGSDGTHCWSKSWSFEGVLELTDMAVSDHGEVYVLSELNYPETDDRPPDVALLKLSTDGELIWEKVWGGAPSTYPHAVADSPGAVALRDDTVIVSGRTWGRMFLLALNSNGEFHWLKMWETSGYPNVKDMAVDYEGNIWCLGRDYDGLNRSWQTFVAGFNQAGEALQAYAVGDDAGPSATSLTALSSGSILIAGHVGSPYVDWRVALLEADSGGNIIWAKAWSADTNAYVATVTKESSELIYVLWGRFQDNWKYTLALAELSNEGDLIRTKRWIKGSEYVSDYPRDLAIGPDGALHIGFEGGRSPSYWIEQANPTLENLVLGKAPFELTEVAHDTSFEELDAAVTSIEPVLDNWSEVNIMKLQVD